MNRDVFRFLLKFRLCRFCIVLADWRRSRHHLLESEELVPSWAGGKVVGEDSSLWLSYVSYVFVCDALFAVVLFLQPLALFASLLLLLAFVITCGMFSLRFAGVDVLSTVLTMTVTTVVGSVLQWWGYYEPPATSCIMSLRCRMSVWICRVSRSRRWNTVCYVFGDSYVVVVLWVERGVRCFGTLFVLYS